MNLVLIGYRGTGKSTLGDILHLKLNMPVHHMDEILQERFEESITSFVEKYGWDSFREEERLLVEELSEMDAIIIDAGGGVITREENITDLRRNGFVVWLQASIDTIAKRIFHDTNRPSLTGNQSHTEEIENVLRERNPLYQKASHFCIQTDDFGFEDCAHKIIQAWKNHLKEHLSPSE